MARPREFQIDKAIHKATLVFWNKGYEQTNSRELMKAMGLRESSFYNTFKSKEKLYLLCLDYYNNECVKNRSMALTSDKNLKDRLLDFFRVIYSEMESTRRGCLVHKSLSYYIISNPSFKSPVTDQILSFKKYFYEMFEQAKKSKELPSDFDSMSIANILFIYLQGIFSTTHIEEDFEGALSDVNLMLESLRF